MPRVNIYIRNEDYAAWKAIEDKPAFIHDALVVGKYDYIDPKLKENYITKPEQVPKRLKEVKGDFKPILKSHSARKKK